MQRGSPFIHGATKIDFKKTSFECSSFIYTNADVSSGLDWHTRCKIIEGICFGLRYLHDESIIHLDLKPANILLDEHFLPKITDFGLSRLFDRNQTIRTATAAGTL
jgi:serine/threonine protein kinase